MSTYYIHFLGNIWHLDVKTWRTTNMLFSSSPLKTYSVIRAIVFLLFINSCTPFNDVGYARTCVGESLNELSPPPPSFPSPPSSVPSTSYYWIPIKSLRLMGEPGLYGTRLWRGWTTAHMAQIRTDSLALMSLEIRTTYLYNMVPWPTRDLWLW